MRRVEPIRQKKKIKAMLNYLKGEDPSGRNATLFRLGISSAYRISDLLSLKHENVFYDDYRFREYVNTRESKTKKYKQYKPPEDVRNIVKAYAKKNKIKRGEWLFPSKKNHQNPLDRTAAWKMLKKAAETVGIRQFGTHSMRKTFGFHYYKNTQDIGLLMRVFNHSSQRETLDYIGIEQEGIDKVYAQVDQLYDFKEDTRW